MGKKGAKRKTRWRVLPIGTEEGGSGSGNDDDDLGSYSRATQKPRPQGRTHSGTNGGGGGGGYYNNKQYYHPRSYGHHESGQPLVTTEKQIFNEEEYTKITTPRQDVLFKKGYLGRKRPVVAVPEPEPGHADDSVEDVVDVEGNEVLDEPAQYIYTNGYMDQTGVYYINGSGYEMFDPYTGQVAVLVGPHYGHPGGPPPLLAAVSCQPVPLQPLEWFNPPGFLPFVQAPCQGAGMQPRDRVKRYSTDSQNCSPVSSESTGPPGSPQESDETGRVGTDLGTPSTPGAPPQLPLVFPHPPPTYVYPGYMFGAPMFNVNGVTVQTTPNQAPSADVTGKRRKKKRKRRRKVNGEGDASEESSSEGGDDKDEASRRDSPSQESSLESDSKLSLSSEEPPYVPVVVEGVSVLNPRAVDFTSAVRVDTPKDGLNVHVDEFEVKAVVNEVDHSKTNGVVETNVDSNFNDECHLLNDKHESKVNDTCDKIEVKAVNNDVTYSKTNGSCIKSNVNGIDLSDKYSSLNNKFESKSNDHVVATVQQVVSQPKLDFASVVSPKVNGHVTSQQAHVEGEEEGAFERYEDFGHVNGFTNGTAEDEWITVKPKTRKSEASHNGHQEKKEVSNGHVKPFKDFRQTNGRGYKQDTRLYKTDARVNGNGRVDASKQRVHEGLYKPNGKVIVNGKMEGNEKERKTSSSSSDGKMESTPVKPSRRERKNKSQSPPQTPEVPASESNPVGMATECKGKVVEAPCVVDVVMKSTSQPLTSESKQEGVVLPVVNAPETSSLDDKVQVKESILPTANAPPTVVPTLSDVVPNEQTQVGCSEADEPITSQEVDSLPSITALCETIDHDDISPQAHEEPETVEAVETKTIPEEVQQLASHPTASQPIASHPTARQPIVRDPTQVETEPPAATPIPPPRRKKYRPPSQRLPERAPTPGKGSDSDSSSSLESEASVIECLSATLDRSDQSGLSSSDEEVIYAGKLGVGQPRLVGKMKVPRNTWARDTPKCEVKVTAPASEVTPSNTQQARELATEIVDSVIEKAVGETSKSRHPNLGITDAVTQWLRSQSPDVLSVSSRDDEMADIAEETEDDDVEESDDDGSKNLQRNPLPVPSASGSEGRSVATTGNRVANKIAETKGNEEWTMPRGEEKPDELRDFHDAELEWDTWDLTPSADRKSEHAYDPHTNDTYQVVDVRAIDTPDLPMEVCPKLYDANLSVAKYYNLAKTASPGEQSSDSEPEELRITTLPDEYHVSLATELARLQQPLPPTWKVAPLVVKSEVEDSGVESGDDGVVVRKPSVFKRKMIGRLKGEGGPFPCGGVCCIVQ